MEKEQILESLAAAIVDGDEDQARESAGAALDRRLDPLEAVEQGLSQGMNVIGAAFGRGDVFLPELLMVAEAFNAAMEVLSCLMTTTMPAQQEVIEVLAEMKLRERFRVMVGGGPVTPGGPPRSGPMATASRRSRLWRRPGG